MAVYSLWHLLSPAAGAFPLGSRILYVARTFLFEPVEAIERFATANIGKLVRTRD